ncbi:tetratricopeptide repeat protein [Aquimarina pacifica]|uniref:tetratricopeptide repeat protein n=1 Tax=Aquimarina pacifica TaxID=1296415 RepID=UPI00046F0DA3|nr:tetratricopeptide repeat protein [Aquimarina pacifica]
MKTYTLVVVRTCIMVIMFMTIGISVGQDKVAQDTLVAQQYFIKADSLSKDLQYNNAILSYQKALPIYQNASTWERVAECYNKIAVEQRKKSSYKESLYTAKKALDICTKYLKKDHRQEAFAYDHMGTYYRSYMVDNEKALRYYEKALAIRKKIRVHYPKDITKSFLAIGVLEFTKGNFKNSLKLFDQSLKISLNEYSEKHYTIAKNYCYIGASYRSMELFDEAVEYYNKSLVLVKSDNSKRALDLQANIHINLGGIYRTLGQYDKALFFLHKSLSAKKELNHVFDDAINSNYNSLGILYKKKGEYDKAIQFYKKALSRYEKIMARVTT